MRPIILPSTRAGPPLLPGLIAASICTRKPNIPSIICGKLDARHDPLGDRLRRTTLGIPIHEHRILDLGESRRACNRRPFVEERFVLEPENGQVNTRADRLDLGGKLVARLVAFHEELAGIKNDVGVCQDALAVNDHSGAARFLRAVLGPGLGQVGIAHRRGDLDDRFANLAFLSIALRLIYAGKGQSRHAEDQGRHPTRNHPSHVHRGTHLRLPNAECLSPPIPIASRGASSRNDPAPREIRRDGKRAIKAEGNRFLSYLVTGRLGRETLISIFNSSLTTRVRLSLILVSRGWVVMIRRLMILVLGLWSILVVGWAQAQETDRQTTAPVTTAGRTDWQAEGTQGAVAAGGRDAVAAGLEILKKGGNAADSAAATILALCVTDSRAFCFGGEVPILIYDAGTKAITVIAGQGAAPRLATLEHFKGRDAIPSRGIEAAAVPAALDACLTLLDRFGTMTFAQVIAPTQALLRRPPRPAAWHADFARTLDTLVDAEVQAHPSGSALPAGDRSRGLRLVADAFYRGPIARRIDAWSSAHGGLIRYVDLATHTTRVEEPVAVGYRGLTIYKCGPWTQGPYLLEALQILKEIDLQAMGHNRPDAVHTIVETMKLALADRDTYYADPLFEDVPLAALLSPEYAALRRGLIDAKHASLERRPGDPRGGKAVLDPAADPARRHVSPPPAAAHDTTTCVVADRFGNVVAATPSGWSGVVAGDTGVWLGSRLQSFNIWSDHPNVIVPGQAPTDHLVAHAGAAGQQARAGHQRGRR